MRDGSFGTTGDCPPIPPEIATAVEAHSFERLTQLCWRNSDLAFSDIDALIGSLMAPAPRAGLVKGNDASDLITLGSLAREPDIRRDAASPRRLRLLWEACQIPDFRKLADDTHTKLCARVFGHIARDEKLPTDWLASNIAGLSRADGDIDTLMQRLAGVRVWSYIAARANWVRDAAHWQGRAREVEELLSDALHERLMSRFVDRRAAHLLRRLDESAGETLLSAVTRKGEVVVEGHSVGHVGGFRFLPDPMAEGEEKKLVLRAARRALREAMPLRVGALEAASGADFSLSETHEIVWDGVPVARLTRGRGALHPRVAVLDSEFLDGPLRERVRQRLQGHVDGMIQQDLLPLLTAIDRAAADSALRGPLHLLEEALGLVPGATEEKIQPALRAQLKTLGVWAGRFALFMPALLKPRAAALRARLWAVQHHARMPALASPGLVSMPPPADWPAGFGAAMGWLETGPVLLRLDIAERLAAELGHATRRGGAATPQNLASRLGIGTDLLPVVLRHLGFRVIPAVALGEAEYGPPAPTMLAPLRRRRPQQAGSAAISPPKSAPAHGPFATLAVLRP